MYIGSPEVGDVITLIFRALGYMQNLVEGVNSGVHAFANAKTQGTRTNQPQTPQDTPVCSVTAHP